MPVKSKGLQILLKGMMTIKIDIQKSHVVLTPESDEEKAKLTALWKLLVDCVGDNRKLAPIGEFVPLKSDKGASFQIEGLELGESSFVEVRLEKDESVICKTCNKLLHLKTGDVIPLCCGEMMAIVD